MDGLDGMGSMDESSHSPIIEFPLHYQMQIMGFRQISYTLNSDGGRGWRGSHMHPWMIDARSTWVRIKPPGRHMISMSPSSSQDNGGLCQVARSRTAHR